MCAHSAAPEGGTSGRGSIGRGRADHNAKSGRVHAVSVTEWHQLPPRIRKLLRAEHLDSPLAWRAAGKRRSEIFGVPPISAGC